MGNPFAISALFLAVVLTGFGAIVRAQVNEAVKSEDINISANTDLRTSIDKVTLGWLTGKMKWGKVGAINAKGVEIPWLDGAVPPEQSGAGRTLFTYGAEDLPTGGRFQQWTASGAAGSMPVETGEKLFVYVFLDPTDPPFEILLQLHAHDTYANRVFWGARNMITHMDPVRVGPVPEAGKWVRLEIDLAKVGRTGVMWLPGMK